MASHNLIFMNNIGFRHKDTCISIACIGYAAVYLSFIWGKIFTPIMHGISFWLLSRILFSSLVQPGCLFIMNRLKSHISLVVAVYWYQIRLRSIFYVGHGSKSRYWSLTWKAPRHICLSIWARY